MNDKTPISRDPYRTPSEVVDAPRRSKRALILVGAIVLMFVSATGIVAAMFLSVSAEQKNDVKLEAYLEDSKWRASIPFVPEKNANEESSER